MELALQAAGVGPATVALFIFPIASALIQLVNGFFADAYGRKPTAVIMGSVSMISFVIFFMGANSGWSPYLIGLLCGLTVGGYWSIGDIIGGMMVSESSPTNLRASILSAQTTVVMLGAMPASILAVVLVSILGNAAIGAVTLCIAVPGMAISLFLLIAKTHDTKGVDLDKVTGSEWD